MPSRAQLPFVGVKAKERFTSQRDWQGFMTRFYAGGVSMKEMNRWDLASCEFGSDEEFLVIAAHLVEVENRAIGPPQAREDHGFVRTVAMQLVMSGRLSFDAELNLQRHGLLGYEVVGFSRHKAWVERAMSGTEMERWAVLTVRSDLTREDLAKLWSNRSKRIRELVAKYPSADPSYAFKVLTQAGGISRRVAFIAGLGPGQVADAAVRAIEVAWQGAEATRIAEKLSGSFLANPKLPGPLKRRVAELMAAAYGVPPRPWDLLAVVTDARVRGWLAGKGGRLLGGQRTLLDARSAPAKRRTRPTGTSPS